MSDLNVTPPLNGTKTRPIPAEPVSVPPPPAPVPADRFIPSGSTAGGEVSITRQPPPAAASPPAPAPPPAPAAPPQNLASTVPGVIPQDLPAPPVPAPPPPAPAPPPPAPSRPYAPPDLGNGFPSVRPDREPLAEKLHDWFASRTPGLFDFAARHAMGMLSDVTQQSAGVNAEDLLDVERTMYRMMVPSRDGYIGGSPPIFQALAQGQAAYVYLKGDPFDSDHLTRLYTGLPPQTLIQLGAGNDKLTPVRQALLDRMQKGDFMAYVDVDGNYHGMNGTESIATESMSSIARQQNILSHGFQNPSDYYKWLVTRVDSAFRRTDPWLYDTHPELHKTIDDVKDDLSPPWLVDPNEDPLGSIPLHAKSQEAYDKVMATVGGGKPPTMKNLSDFADTAVSLDRDLLFAVQTYWTKLMREVSPGQRESLFAPLVSTWVNLNTVPPDSPDFDQVSPPDAPYIELIDKHTGAFIMERYDRAMAMGEVLDHTLDGLGIDQRKELIGDLMTQIRGHQSDLEAREQRIRSMLGNSYQGLDVDGILSGRVDINDPGVKTGLEQLRKALNNGVIVRPMTSGHAEILRHMGMLDWVARHNVKYPDPAMELSQKLPPQSHDPVMVGEFYPGDDPLPASPLPAGPSSVEVLGKPRPGHAPLPASMVFEGGGGKGFAYVECVKQLEDALRNADGQVAVDRYAGTSAGAITAGLLAAGYSPTEMSGILEMLDFKKFYADYLWLAGGVDPQVRGIDRTGLFTTRQMYQTLATLLARKVHVQGRPVLFRDLPFKLSVCATVLDTNLPDDLKKQLGVGKDGQIVFSNENTPNMDVAAAICASAAVPGFFNAPQIQMVRDEPDGKGGTVKQEYRLQLMDGGVVNGFPVAMGADPNDQKPMLVVPPAYYQAPGARPGDPPVQLSTLNFDPADLSAINAYNDKRYAEFAPKLGGVLQQAQDSGADRAVIGFHLATPSDQTAPLVQGTTLAESEQYHQMADAAGMPAMSVKDADAIMHNAFPHKSSFAEQFVLDKMLDTQHTLKPGLCHEPVYTPGTREAPGVGDVLMSVVAAQSVAPDHIQAKLFEKA